MCCRGLLSSPKEVSRTLLRVFFGLSLFCVGVVHYKTIGEFSAFVGDGLGPLTMVGVAWGYVLPALMIIGGALFVIGMFPVWAVWAAGLALGSIPAGILLKSVVTDMSLGDTMPGAINAFTWLIVYMFAAKAFCGCNKKATCCSGPCCDSKGACMNKDCKCTDCKCGGDCKCAPGQSCKDGCCK